MKSLTFFALSVIASAAMAADPAPAPQISITGISTQSVLLTSSAVSNESSGSKSEALQNVASNAGNVSISGISLQTVTARDSLISNESSGSNTYASQNVSSNFGEVDITRNSIQMTNLMNSALTNLASGSNSKAVPQEAHWTRSNAPANSKDPSAHWDGTLVLALPPR